MFNRNLLFLVFLILLLLPLDCILAAEFSVDAVVDRTEVGFGESFNLVLTVTQSVGSGRTQRLSIPDVQNIPGFDIVSRRSGQSTRFINGVGQASSQIVYELVPQAPGKVSIPAFSITDPMGEIHKTKAIEITVQEPVPAGADSVKPQNPSPQNEDDSGRFRFLLLIGFILVGLVAVLFVFASLLRSDTGEAPQGETVVVADSEYVRDNSVEDAQIVDANASSPGPAVSMRVDFVAEVDRLKRQCPEVDREFYRQYFDIFLASLVSCNSALSRDMTADEIFRKVVSICGSDMLSPSCKRMAADLEMVMYANQSPSRSFSAIDGDAREIISAINE